MSLCLSSIFVVSFFWVATGDVLLRYPLHGAASRVCPNNATECLRHHTCCQASDNGWGCCPYSNAVCCGDGKHCCPEEYECVGEDKESSCVKRVAGSQDQPLKDPLTNPGDPPHWLPGSVCADGSVCPGQFSTCCSTNTTDVRYLCCPVPKGVCCNNGEYCCSSRDAGCSPDAADHCLLNDGTVIAAYKSHSTYKHQLP